MRIKSWHCPGENAKKKDREREYISPKSTGNTLFLTLIVSFTKIYVILKSALSRIIFVRPVYFVLNMLAVRLVPTANLIVLGQLTDVEVISVYNKSRNRRQDEDYAPKDKQCRSPITNTREAR